MAAAEIPTGGQLLSLRAPRGKELLPKALVSEEELVSAFHAAPSLVRTLGDAAPSVKDFFDDRCAALAQAIYEIAEDDSEKVDDGAIERVLIQRDLAFRFESSGGFQVYLAMLGTRTLGRPIDGASHAQQWAESIRETARRRRVMLQTVELDRAVQLGDQELEARARASLALLSPDAVHAKAKSTPTWPTLAARALALGVDGQTLVSGFATLNVAMRGGLRTGKVVVVGGAPGAGKTTMTVQMALEWARAGVHVGILAADEDANGLLIRLGQQLGLSRENLEAGQREAREELAARVEQVPRLLLVDADEQNVTIDDMSDELARRAAGAPSVMIVDSIQTVRTAGTDVADSPRARVDAVMAALKRHAKVAHHLVIATCELARDAYRNRDSKDRIDDLAAFKESGGIEYAAAVAMVLRSVPERLGLVDVSIAKNRLGQKLGYRIALDERRATFVEVEKADAEEDGVRGAKINIESLTKMKNKILFVLGHTPEPLRSGNQIYARTKGWKKHFLPAFNELEEEGKLHWDAAKKCFVLGPKPVGLSENIPVCKPAGDPENGLPVSRAHAPRRGAAQTGKPPGQGDSAGAVEAGGLQTTPVCKPGDEPDPAIEAALDILKGGGVQ